MNVRLFTEVMENMPRGTFYKETFGGSGEGHEGKQCDNAPDQHAGGCIR